MANLTVREIEALKARAKPYVARVSDGLYVRISVDGEKQWLVRFSIDGKQRDARLPGRYGSKPGPGVMTLAEARYRREEVQALAKQGVDFRDQEIKEREAAQHLSEQQAEQRRTVKDLYDAWVKQGVKRKDGNAEIKRLFGVDVLPWVGAIELAKLTESDILEVLHRQLSRGVVRLAVMTYKDISQMLNWGEKRQPWRRLLIDGNPASLIDIEQLLPDDYEDERDRVLSQAEICELAAIFKEMDKDFENAADKRAAKNPVSEKTRLALWICLSTLCRIGELLQAEWRHVNLDTKEWFIPAKNTKGRRGKRQPHYVFLSDFAASQFKALRGLTGKSRWCFPAKNNTKKAAVGEATRDTHVCLKSVSKQVGDRQIRFKNRTKVPKGRAFDDSLVLAGGENGEWTPPPSVTIDVRSVDLSF